MERDELERCLADGLSLAEIGALAKTSESTVSRWLKKYGLPPVHRERHAARGGIPRETLENYVRLGLSMRAMARDLGVGLATVRYWMAKHELEASAYIRGDGPEGRKASELTRTCARHGLATFVRSGARGYYRCKQCRTADVSAGRRRMKLTLIEEAGGKCAMCGYDRCPAALHFHHLDPASKSFELSRHGVTRSIASAREEARKCVLLCANCHAEVEIGLSSLPLLERGEAPRGGLEPP